jgi:hypothetical protein
VSKPEEKRPLRRPRRRWEDNTEMDIKDIRWVGIDWIDLARDTGALGNTTRNLRVP